MFYSSEKWAYNTNNRLQQFEKPPMNKRRGSKKEKNGNIQRKIQERRQSRLNSYDKNSNSTQEVETEYPVEGYKIPEYVPINESPFRLHGISQIVNFCL
jgi:hypothetical protein